MQQPLTLPSNPDSKGGAGQFFRWRCYFIQNSHSTTNRQARAASENQRAVPMFAEFSRSRFFLELSASCKYFLHMLQKATTCCQMLRKSAKFRFLGRASGQPICNIPGECFSLLWRVQPPLPLPLRLFFLALTLVATTVFYELTSSHALYLCLYIHFSRKT